MIFIHIENNGKIRTILNERTDCDFTESKSIDVHKTEKSFDHSKFKEETIICDICESVIEDQRWHCIDCYEDRLGVDLCQNCWSHHNRVHHLIVLKHNEHSHSVDRKWTYQGIIKILDVLKDDTYSCLSCGCKLTKFGLAVSFNVEIECLSMNRRKINSDFLLCLDDFNNFNCSKLESVYTNGSYSLVEWINQYDRRGWHEIISNINKQELKLIISYINVMNQEERMECNICSAPVNDRIWVCMEQNCNKNIDEESVLSRPENLCVLICENHIGANQLCQNSSFSHKIVCMFKGKVQNSVTGSSNMWIPKNLFRNHPHLIEKRMYLQKQIVSKVNNEDFAKLALNKWKDASNRPSEQGSLFANVHLLDDIGSDCDSENNDINSMYKNPAPGYEYLNNLQDSLAAFNFEGEENTSYYGISEDRDYSNKSIPPDEDKEELEKLEEFDEQSCDDLDLHHFFDYFLSLN